MTYKFIQDNTEQYVRAMNIGYASINPVQSIEMTLSGETSLTEMLQSFEQFLRASGFYFDGQLDIVPLEEERTFYDEDDTEEEYAEAISTGRFAQIVADHEKYLDSKREPNGGQEFA